MKKNYRIIAVDLSKQKALDVDSRATQQIIFTGEIKSTVANTREIIFYVLQKSKETILEFSKGTTKSFVSKYNAIVNQKILSRSFSLSLSFSSWLLVLLLWLSWYYDYYYYWYI